RMPRWACGSGRGPGGCPPGRRSAVGEAWHDREWTVRLTEDYGETFVFWFLLIALVVVVAAVTLAVAGGGGGGTLPEAGPDAAFRPFPAQRPLGRADVEALRLPVALRGYRMDETDDALDRLGAEL